MTPTSKRPLNVSFISYARSSRDSFDRGRADSPTFPDSASNTWQTPGGGGAAKTL
ncbi:hypothetical protein BD311DRAFT_770363 [Dichomitus squalens]|uniref:Uncharacterized protein n=1 Tax=Dichomitus squalens TaxID=114155 RepID=A0A4Q9M6D0_9APHY|nr:hypothetical protein BD311DRAFT_770363 [Dichomitus squalens]